MPEAVCPRESFLKLTRGGERAGQRRCAQTPGLRTSVSTNDTRFLDQPRLTERCGSQKTSCGHLDVARARELRGRPVPATSLSLEKLLPGTDDLNIHSVTLQSRGTSRPSSSGHKHEESKFHPGSVHINTPTLNGHFYCRLQVQASILFLLVYFLSLPSHSILCTGARAAL